MKLGIVTDVQVVEHRGRLVSPSAMLPQVTGFCPYFDEVLIFSPATPPFDQARPDLQCIEPGNIRVVAIPGFWPRRVYGFLMTWPRVWAGLRRALPQADLVNIRMPALCSLLGRALCRQLRIPYFVSIHGDWAEQFRIAAARGGWRRLLPHLAWLPELVTLAVARDSIVFATSRPILQRIQPLARAAYLTFSSLLDESELTDRPKQLDRSRPLRLLYVGQVAVHKGIDYALQAARLLAERGVNFEFHIVGDGPMLATGRAFVRQHGLEGRFVFHGFVPYGPQLRQHYRRADLFVFPSLSEGSPKVVLEAMAQALPIVSTAVGAVSSYATDGVHGRLVPPRDSRAIAEAVINLADDASRYSQMSAACMDTAAKLTLARVTQRWIDDLSRVGLYRPNPGDS